jgi:uncharacterized membrane protein YhaH (DUF805 family)
MTWALMPLKKYAVFTGRSRRKEYWMFLLLFTLLPSICFGTIDWLAGTSDLVVNLLSWLVSVAILVPSIAVTTRRLHDSGKSGWRQLLFFIPLVGIVLWIIWMVRDGDDGVNNYGPNPKTAAVYPPRRTAPA